MRIKIFSMSMLIMVASQAVCGESGTKYFYRATFLDSALKSKTTISPITSRKIIGVSAAHTIIPAAAGFLMMVKGGSSAEMNHWGLIPLVYGLWVGPSIGSLQAKDTKTALVGFGIRASSVVVFLLGMNPTSEGVGFSESTTVLALGTLGAGILYNFLKAPASAERFNARHRLSLSPQFDPFRKQVGLNLELSF